MEQLEILPAIDPARLPRAVHKALNVPVTKLPVLTQQMPKVPETMSAGKAPRTRVPMGFTMPDQFHNLGISRDLIG